MTDIETLLRRIEDRFGLVPRAHGVDQVAAAATEQAKRSGLPRGMALAAALHDPSLLRELAAAMTVEETYFFRHPEHYPLVTEHLAARVRASGTATAWSAGCATGEEAYSVAMAMVDVSPPVDTTQVRLVATDLNARSLRRALEGAYGPWSFRGTSELTRARFFSPRADGRFDLLPTIRARVEFVEASIQEALVELIPSRVDVILFRNVAVYLSAEAVGSIYEGFAAALRPGGLLFVAPTDPRPTGPEWTPRAPDDTTVFVRREATASAAVGPGARTARPEPVPTRPRPAVPGLVEQARKLADRGELARAIDLIDEYLQARPHEPAAALVRAQICVAAGRLGEALETLDRLLDRTPDHALARFWRLITLQALGESVGVVAELSRLRDDLEVPRAAATLGVTRGEARELREALGEMLEVAPDR